MISKKIFDVDGHYWYNKDNNLHREDGPAIESFDGYKAWIINGKYHRLEGPARIFPDGSSYWYLDGDEFHEQYHPFSIFRKEYNLSNEYIEWTKDMKALFKLIHG